MTSSPALSDVARARHREGHAPRDPQPGGLRLRQCLRSTRPRAFPGIRLRPLWKGPDGAQANVLEMDAGTSWPRRDVHEPGPEEVYVVAGTFNDGARD